MTTRVRASILALAFAAIVTLPAIATAQTPLTIGVKAGVNIAKLSFEDDDDDLFDDEDDFDHDEDDFEYNDDD